MRATPSTLYIYIYIYIYIWEVGACTFIFVSALVCNAERVDFNITLLSPPADASVSTLWDSDDWWRLGENCGRDEPLYTNVDYIHRFLPNAKIIIILRDPTERCVLMLLFIERCRHAIAISAKKKKINKRVYE